MTNPKRLAKRVLVIGWDAADWKVINPMLDAGELPALQSLVENGVCGNFATLDPPLSPMLWTSIATGKRPHKHGILGFLEPDESGKKLRQTHVSSRKVKAVWNILNQQGMRSNVVGWWPSHPAEPVRGRIISNFYQTANFSQSPQNWPLPKGVVHPESEHELFAGLRVHPTELTEAHILPFVPGAAAIDQEKDGSLMKLTRQLAECASIHNAATYILENDKDWDFMGIYYEAIDLISHAFMKFHPPKMDHINPERFELYNGVVRGIYRFHDMMLERTLQLVDEDTTVIILSDHGFYSDHLRPRALPKEPAAIALEHAPYGIFVAKGPHIRKDERVFGVGVLDIAPTILTLLGLPVAADMDGKPLVQIFEEPVSPDVIPSWEYVDGDSGQHPREFRADLYEVHDDKAMQQLADLGYIEQPGETNDEENFQNNLKENRFYLARSYYSARDYQQAIDILEELVHEKPAKERFLRYLLECHLYLNHTQRSRELLEEWKTISGQENQYSLLMSEGHILMGENRLNEAIRCFEKADQMTRSGMHSRLSLGNAYMKAKRWNDAVAIFTKELAYDPNSHSAYYGLGVCHYQLGDYESAIDNLLDSIGLLYFNAFAHYHLGEAFMAVKMYNEAAQAYEIALRLDPKLGMARQQLETVCRDHLGDAARYERIVSEDPYRDAEEIVIVSGLPRSGTSMMMQMLEAGGLPVFTDNLRRADENNRKGYYEHEAVKALHKDNTWIGNSVGKVLKVVSNLLYYLPPRYKYKIVFMERDLLEILDSQHQMLHNLGKLQAGSVHFTLENNFRESLVKVKDWLSRQPNMDVRHISYYDCLDKPDAVTKELQDFFEGKLNTDAMRAVIDRTLYRTQSKKTS